MVALTFDDGPGARTSELLDMLERYNAHATFFVSGSPASSRGYLLARMDSIGCEIGNHTYSHSKLSSLNSSSIDSEIDRVDAIVQSNKGHKTTLLRPPYGAYNQIVSNTAGKPIILWSIDTLDWKTENANTTVNSVLSNVKDGDIVLMHDIHSESIDAALVLFRNL